MKKWLFRLIWVPVLVVAVLFLVANRTPVVISLDPFNPDNPVLSTPAVFLWVWLMLMLFVGLWPRLPWDLAFRARDPCSGA